MIRRVLDDKIWEQLEATLKAHGCHRWPNDREIFEAILWKFRTGGPWRDLPAEFCPWKTAYNRFNRWAAKGLWDAFFLSYEAKLIRNGYSSTEVTFALTNMQVELGMATSEQLASLGADQPPKFMLLPMRMEIRSILKSLGVKCTTVRLRTS